MRRCRRCLPALLLGSLLLAACGNDQTPTTPSPVRVDVTGRWAGDITFQGTTGRMTWTLTQSGTTATGPVILALPSGTVLLNGQLTGTVTGPSFVYSIVVGAGGIPTQPNCTGQMGGTMTVTEAATSSMSGSIAVTSSNCPIAFSNNTFVMAKL